MSAEICSMSINIDEATRAENSTQQKVSLSAGHSANFKNFTYQPTQGVEITDTKLRHFVDHCENTTA